MFKLLPDKDRELMRREYKHRRIIVWLVGLSFILIIGIVGLFPSYIISSSRLGQAEERFDIIEETNIRDGDKDQLAWLDATTRKLGLLDPALDKDRPSLAIEAFLKEKIPGIKIKGISWQWFEEGIDLKVEGLSTDRQTLIKFEEALSASNYFSDVTLPVSNLAKERDIEFQIALRYKVI